MLKKAVRDSYFTVSKVGNPSFTTITELLRYYGKTPAYILNFITGLLKKSGPLRRYYELFRQGKIDRFINSDEFLWYRNLCRNLLISKLVPELRIRYA